jgi:hypothetical protein
VSARRLARVLWVVVGLAVAFFAGQAAAPDAALYRRLGGDAIGWIGMVPKALLLATAALAAVAAAGRFEAGNPMRPGWRLYGVGMGGQLLGQCVLAYHLARGHGSVFPSVGDLFFVGGCLLIVGGLVAFVRAYVASGFPLGHAAQLWAVGLAAAALGALLVAPLLRPVIAADVPPLEKALNVAYPSIDFLMLVPALLLLWIASRFRGGGVGKVWSALVAGILFTASADVLFGYFSNLERTDLGAAIDALYLLAYGCLAAAPLCQRELQSG